MVSHRQLPRAILLAGSGKFEVLKLRTYVKNLRGSAVTTSARFLTVIDELFWCEDEHVIASNLFYKLFPTKTILEGLCS